MLDLGGKLAVVKERRTASCIALLYRQLPTKDIGKKGFSCRRPSGECHTPNRQCLFSSKLCAFDINDQTMAIKKSSPNVQIRKCGLQLQSFQMYKHDENACTCYTLEIRIKVLHWHFKELYKYNRREA